MIEMHAISLLQPWASLLAGGEKHWETRSWSCPLKYVGRRIAIHASKSFTRENRELAQSSVFAAALRRLGYQRPDDLPLGAIIGMASLQLVAPTFRVRSTLSENELAFGNYEPLRWAWKFADANLFTAPIPHRGALSLWIVPRDVAGRVEAARASS